MDYDNSYFLADAAISNELFKLFSEYPRTFSISVAKAIIDDERLRNFEKYSNRPK